MRETITENREKVNSFVAQVLKLKLIIFIRCYLSWVENSEQLEEKMAKESEKGRTNSIG